MKKIIFTYLILISFSSYSQVNLGSLNAVNSNVILDLDNDQGRVLLLPQPSILPNTPEGIMFYDPSKKYVFYSKDGSNLNALSPWKFQPENNNNITFNVSGGNVGIGLSNPSVKLTIDNGTDAELSNTNSGYLLIGDKSGKHLLFDDNEIMAKNGNANSTLHLQADGGNVNINGSLKEDGFKLIPEGTIIMWYGFIDGVNPEIGGVKNTNWRICDGNGGTPNLEDRFVVGIGTLETSPDYGGVDSPEHRHYINLPATNTNSDGGGHSHTSGSSNSNTNTSGAAGFFSGCWGSNSDGAKTDHTHSSTSESKHTHSIDVYGKYSDNSSIDNKPPYFGLFYIMKI